MDNYFWFICLYCGYKEKIYEPFPVYGSVMICPECSTHWVLNPATEDFKNFILEEFLDNEFTENFLD